MKSMIIAAAGACLLAACSAAPECMPRQDLVRALVGQYGERPVGAGFDLQERPVELWAGPGGTFTVLIIPSSAEACLLASGVTMARRGGQGS